MLHALVTGSNGFIGSTLVERLLKEKYRVRCLVRKTSNLKWLEGLSVVYAYGELLAPETLTSAVRDIDIVFHLGGRTKAKHQKEFMAGNYLATLNLLNACNRLTQKPRFLFVSSQAAGGPSHNSTPKTENSESTPISLYGISKLAAEKSVLQFAHKFPVTIIRPPSVYGPKDRDVFLMFKNIHNGISPQLNRGQQKLSMVYIDDLVDGIILAANSENAKGQIFNISGDEILAWKQIANILKKAMNKRAIPINIPLWILDVVSIFSTALSKFSNKPLLLNRDKIQETRQVEHLRLNFKLSSNQCIYIKRDVKCVCDKTIDKEI